MSGILLNIDRVFKSFNDKKALQAISLSVRKGVIYGLIGHNGAGKTTLLRILTQIFTPDDGEIFLKGESLASKHIKKIGYLPEERGLYTGMKVVDYLLFLAQLHEIKRPEAKEKIKWWLNQLSISEYEKVEIRKLSKGNQQKIQFIATVFFEPELLILDEPFSGLDPSNLELIKKEILRLNEIGTTILFSTHQMEAVEDICSEISMIHKGEIVLSGSLETIKKGEFIKYYIETDEQLVLSDSVKECLNGYVVTFKSEIEKEVFMGKLDSSKLVRFYPYERSLREVFLDKVSVS